MYELDSSVKISRVADVAATTLRAHGISHAFGVPGGEVVTLIDALERAGIGFTLARHETSAAIMAAGASSVTGKPQILVTTVGPGLANAVNGIADAVQERVPLVVLSGIVDRPTRARYTHQVIDHAALLRPVVKASFEIEPESVSSTIARAIAIATTEPMGPVHIDISPAIALSRIDNPQIVSPARIVRPAVSLAGADAVLDRISRSQNPVIVAGYEATRDNAGAAILALAEKIGAPVITSYKAKGTIPEDHELSMGGAGLSPLADRLLLDLCRQSDLVLAVGYDPIEMRLGWLDFVPDGEKLVEITHMVADHGMHHSGTRIVASPKAFVEALCERVERHATWADKTPTRLRAELESLFATKAEWGPHAIVDELNRGCSPDTIVTVDSGAHRILLSQKWRAKSPVTLLQSAGFCTMNTALPLAIGAKVADPERRLVAVMGDGGLEMGIGELASLRDLGLPLTIVVFQDRSLALIALKQAAQGLAPLGVELGETDFATVARGFGGHGINVETIDEFRNELDAATRRDGFTLIACRFPASHYDGAF